MDPLAVGILYPALVDYMVAEDEAKGPRPTAAGTRLRASEALMCARAIGLRIEDVPVTDEVPPETLFAFSIGNTIHEKIQAVALAQLPGAEIEVVGDYTPIGIDLSCHADIVYDQDLFNPGTDPTTRKVVGEIKSISGYGFLLAIGARKGPEPPGPKDGHVIQAVLAAMAPNIDAKWVHLIYIDKDKHGIAEWRFDLDEQYTRYHTTMTLREIGQAEIERMQGILGRLDNRLIPARHIPGFGRVNIVPTPDSRDDPWNCRYCRYNRLCRELETSPQPVDIVLEIADELEG